MDLKHSFETKSETTITVDSDDLEEFNAAKYGIQHFDIYEISPDKPQSYTVTNYGLPESARKHVNEAIEFLGTEYDFLGYILQDLKDKGHIIAGNYLVEANW